MKKFINDPSNIISEMINGMITAHPNTIAQLNNLPIIVRKNKKINKVALISGGGSGHEPAHAGYVGYGMLDSAIIGEVFTSPSADKVYEAIKYSDAGKGVLLIIKNYSGDIMNFEMGADMASLDGINVKKIIVNDDIAVENSTYTTGRRGIAGTVLVHKIVGAGAERGYSLDELEILGNKVINSIRSFGVSIEPCTLPTTGKMSFELKDDEIEIGLGIHGEPGTHREKLQQVNTHIDYMIDKLFKEYEFSRNDKVAVMINGLGKTTLMELYIINNYVHKLLSDNSLNISKTFVGNYMTSLDMNGFSITLLKLDSEMEELLNDEVNTISFK